MKVSGQQAHGLCPGRWGGWILDDPPPEVSVHRPPATEIKDISWGAEDQAGTPTTG